VDVLGVDIAIGDVRDACEFGDGYWALFAVPVPMKCVFKLLRDLAGGERLTDQLLIDGFGMVGRSIGISDRGGVVLCGPRLWREHEEPHCDVERWLAAMVRDDTSDSAVFFSWVLKGRIKKAVVEVLLTVVLGHRVGISNVEAFSAAPVWRCWPEYDLHHR